MHQRVRGSSLGFTHALVHASMLRVTCYQCAGAVLTASCMSSVRVHILVRKCTCGGTSRARQTSFPVFSVQVLSCVPHACLNACVHRLLDARTRECIRARPISSNSATPLGLQFATSRSCFSPRFLSCYYERRFCTVYAFSRSLQY